MVGGDLAGVRVVGVAAGDAHSIALAADGRVFTFGEGEYGQLGHGDGISRTLPQRVAGALASLRVVRVACGTSHVAVVTEDGSLLTFGRGGGRLGHPTMDNVLEPLLVNGLLGSVVREVACGSMHTAVVCDDGTLHTFGRGSEGQLGLDLSRVVQPTRVSTGILSEAAVVAVDCGEQHTAVVTLDGYLVTFGMGDATPAVASLPEASDGSAGHGLSKFSCGRSATAAVRHDGHLFTVGHTQNSGALERAE